MVNWNHKRIRKLVDASVPHESILQSVRNNIEAEESENDAVVRQILQAGMSSNARPGKSARVQGRGLQMFKLLLFTNDEETHDDANGNCAHAN